MIDYKITQVKVMSGDLFKHPDGTSVQCDKCHKIIPPISKRLTIGDLNSDDKENGQFSWVVLCPSCSQIFIDFMRGAK